MEKKELCFKLVKCGLLACDAIEGMVAAMALP